MRQHAAGPGHAAVPRTPGRGRLERTFLVVASALAASCVAAWVTAMLLMRNRGFDITDEGYYLLSYRWWHTNLRAATGAQYLYGPVFTLVGHDIVALRVVRLATVLLANSALGWSFMRWLRGRRPTAPSTRWWEVAGTLAIVAAGGMVLAWLPLSPGYNDLTALGSVLGTALVFVIARYAVQPGTLPLWPAFALGAVSLGLVLTKWTCAPAVVALLGAAVLLTVSRGRRDVVRLISSFASGFVVATACVHLFVVRLDDAVPPMLSVNRLSSQGDHQVADIVRSYLDSTWALAWHTAHAHAPLLAVTVAVSAAWRARPRGAALVAVTAVVLAAFLNSLRVIVDNGGLHGGPPSIDAFSSALLAMTTTAAVACIVPVASRAGPRPWSTTGVARLTPPLTLLVVPFLQGIGTNVRLTSIAENAFGCWMALLILLITAVESRAVLVRGLALAATGTTLVLSAVITFDGLVYHPYRAMPYSQDTTAVPGDTPLGSVRLPAATTREYAALRTTLLQEFHRSPEPVLALDKMPGLLLLLGARPVGEAWTGPTATLRSAAGLVDECERGLLRRPPVLLYNRARSASDLDALASCGFKLRRDYRIVPVPNGPPGVTVYVPK